MSERLVYFPAALKEMTPEGLDKIKELVHSAMFAVLRQEVNRFNQLLLLIHKSLKGILVAAKGDTLMSQSLEDMHRELLIQRVPSEWKVSCCLIPLQSFVSNMLVLCLLLVCLFDTMCRIFSSSSSFTINLAFLPRVMQDQLFANERQEDCFPLILSPMYYFAWEM